MAAPDIFTRAHADGLKAVATFLPSLNPPPPSPPQAPQPQRSSALTEAVRAMSLARHGEMMSARVARGLPPSPPPPPTPEQSFGNALDVVHTRAISSAIAAHPEEDRARLISEAHDSATKWVGSHNGKVVVHGKVEVATSPESAERLAQKIVNGAVDEHDQRKEMDAQVALASKTSPTSDSAPSTRGGKESAASSAPGTSGPETSPLPQSRSASPNTTTPVGSPDPATGRTVTHGTDDLKAAQKNATAAAPVLDKTLQSATSNVPGARVAGFRDKKTPERAQQKVESEDKPANTIPDLLAARIAVDSPEAKEAVVNNIKNQAPVIDEDDKFHEGDSDYGFRSHTLQVAMPNDSSAEVQVIPKEMADVGADTHKTYEKGREAEVNGDDDTTNQAMTENKAAHDDAMDQFNARNSDQSLRIRQILEAGGMKLTGEPIKLGGKTFVGIHPAEIESGDGETLGPAASVGQGVEADGSASEAEDGPTDAVGEPAEEADQGDTEDARSGTSGRDDHIESRTGEIRESQPRRSGEPNTRSSKEPIKKGDTVQLKSGEQGKVEYIHPNMNTARVRVDGKSRTINTLKD